MKFALLLSRRCKKLLRTINSAVPESAQVPAYYYYRRLLGNLEGELKYLPQLLKGCNTAVDVGANRGLYTFVLSKHCKQVIAFEPQESCARKLSQFGGGRVTVKNVALSNHRGSATLFVPSSADNTAIDGFASLTKSGDSQELVVPVERLDDYGLQDVDFIKIDVEGHEWEVLEGSLETIAREKPIMLVEVEQRHQERAIGGIFAMISKLGYSGFFLEKGELVPLERFSYEQHQAPFLNDVSDPRYVNNFFFMPDGPAAKASRGDQARK